ncbi:MAG: LytTR family DNA-binding domain-containing protein [Lachnospiraceae bacterium]|nr:LytTR family DNA-binding domain-containing protein [Lachnospiraceae bacterium]
MKEILIVEDKETAALALEKIVRKECESANVYIANNLEKALTIAMMKDIELMLVDIVLNPEKKEDMSGIEFVSKIRGVDKYSFVPVIMVTSLEDPRMIAYEQLRCFSFIEKPYDEGEIRTVIREALKYKTPYADNKYFFKSDGVIYSINKNEILYIQTVGKKMQVILENDEMDIPYIPIKKLAVEFFSDFIQCSRNCIVNKKHIENIDVVNRFIKVKGCEEKLVIGKSVINNFRGLV